MGDFKILQKYHSLLRPFLAVFLISIFFDIVVTLLGLSMPLLTRVLFDYAYAFRDLPLLNLTIAAIIVTYFLYFFLSVSSDYLQIYVDQETTARLTKKVFHTLQRLPLGFHHEKKPGDLLIRITDDVSNTVGMITSVLPAVLIDGGRFVVILLIALNINVKLTLLALLSIPLYILEAKFYAGRLARVEQESIDADSDIYTRAQERLSNIKTVKAYGQENREALSFGRLLRRRYRVAVKGRFLEVVQTFTNSLTLQMWTVFLTWFLGYQVVKGRLTIGEIVALMLYIEQLGDPIRSFISLFTEWKTNLVSMRRLDEVLEHPTEEKGRGGKHLQITEGGVETISLSFAYAPDEKVLHDIEVKFEPRTVTAIVGGSGSGKTTLVNLLIRFFNPSAGMILVDDQNISEVRIHELRGKVGIVMQDTGLFDGTVLENILYGNEEKSRADAIRVAQLAGAHDFIQHLPGGYDSSVGTGGELLSGGQRQRLVIARTLLRNPSIFIFDEATSALDAESEYRIQEVVSQLRNTKTVIVIAHRLSTIKLADKIMVLEEGKFVEEGQFDELIERRGVFYHYYWRQFGGLAAFRQHLTMELERSARYGSRFSLAILRIGNYDEIRSKEGAAAAEQFMEEVDFHIKRHIRTGDNCARFVRDTILLLLPEIDVEHLKQFFGRMIHVLPQTSAEELPRPIKARQLHFTGTQITKKAFRTPEELIYALMEEAKKIPFEEGYTLIDEDELAKRHAGERNV